jgi:type II secretory pathway pseudopilin PulG
MHHTIRTHSAFSLVEVLVVLAISVTLVAVSVGAIGVRRVDRVVRRATESVITVLRDTQSAARTRSEGSAWGVHFESGTYAVFRGSAYATSAITRAYALDPVIHFSFPNSVTSSTILFSILSGAPNSADTVFISPVAGSGPTSTIRVATSGLIYAE